MIKFTFYHQIQYSKLLVHLSITCKKKSHFLQNNQLNPSKNYSHMNFYYLCNYNTKTKIFFYFLLYRHYISKKSPLTVTIFSHSSFSKIIKYPTTCICFLHQFIFYLFIRKINTARTYIR